MATTWASTYELFGFIPISATFAATLGPISGTVSTAGRWTLSTSVSIHATSVKLLGVNLLKNPTACASASRGPVTLSEYSATGGATSPISLAGGVDLAPFTGCGGLTGQLNNAVAHPENLVLVLYPQ